MASIRNLKHAKEFGRFVGAAAVGLALLASPGVASAAELPANSTAAHVVMDESGGKVRSKHDEHRKFRAASVVKLLIAVDHLERLDQAKPIPEEDKLLLQPMLRSSNDDAASDFWLRNGGAEIIERSVAKMGLQDTVPPPADQSSVWGYTGTSASDIAKTYRYILDKTDARTRDFVLTNLGKHTKCAADGFDQSFGLPSAAPEADAAKQGWSGFGDGPAPGQECNDSDDPARTGQLLSSEPVQRSKTSASAESRGGARPFAANGDVDLTRRAMHTTGIADGKIVVLLTLQPDGTPWQTAADGVTASTEELLAG